MRFRTRLAALAAIPALALSAGLAAATAASASTTNISFSSSARNSAHWNAGHTALVFDMNSASAPTGQGGYGYAVANLHGMPGTLPSQEPTFSTTGYAAGTPRMDIFFSDGSYLFVYPNGTYQGNGPGEVGQINYTSDWNRAVAAAADEGLTVTQVFMVADASQPVPYVATVTALQYAGASYVGG